MITAIAIVGVVGLIAIAWFIGFAIGAYTCKRMIKEGKLKVED